MKYHQAAPIRPADEPEARRTVIRTPRNEAMFPGWGVRF